MPEQYKKYNPNPTPTTHMEFPSYEEWVKQKEAGTLPSYFDTSGKPLLNIPTGAYEKTRTEMPGEYLTQWPTAMPTETGMPTEEGVETGMPDVLNQIMGTYGIEDPLEALQLFIDMSAGEQETLGYQPPVEEEKPMIFPETREEFIDQKIKGGMKSSEIKGLSDLLYPEEEEAKLTSIDVMRLGQEQGFTTKEEYINALMGELGMDYEKALNFYLTYTAKHPEYPKE